MKILFFVFGIFVMFIASGAGLEMPNWNTELCKEHPRLLFNSSQLPDIRKRAQNSGKKDFEALKKIAESDVDIGELKLNTKNFTYRENGKIKLNPGVNTMSQMVENMHVKEASSAALVYLINGDTAMRDRAIKLLLHLDKLLRFALEFDVPIDYHTELMMNLMCTYDWMYNDLTPEQRRDIGGNIAEYVQEMQPEGRLKVFKSAGGPETGFYGTLGMLFPAGIILKGSGVDEDLVTKFLNDGYAVALEAMNFRDKISGDKGLLVAGTPTYSFGAYPIATFLFFMENRAALNRDVRMDFSHMRNFVNWFLWATIPDGNGGFYHYGYGDVRHSDNRFDHSHIYGHFAQIVNIYADILPETADRAAALLNALPPELKRFNSWHPFMPLLMGNFNPEFQPKTSIAKLTENESGCYFPYFGLAFMRTSYTPDGTFAMFRTGSESINHQHYDENSFIIYRNGFQALDTGDRMMAYHHTQYYPQTIAHNAMLIDMPEEPMPPHWWHWSEEQRPLVEDGNIYYCDGGQNDRVSGKMLIFETSTEFTWTSGDATKSYSNKKCLLAQREFVFIPPHFFVVFDRVESTLPEYGKRWVLHLQNQSERNGSWWLSDNGTGGELRWKTLLPSDAVEKLIGGQGREFFTNNRNFPLNTGDDAFKKPNFYGQWRYEAQGGVRSHENFLTILHAAAPGEPWINVIVNGENGVTVNVDDETTYEVLFNLETPGGTIEKKVNGKSVMKKNVSVK